MFRLFENFSVCGNNRQSYSISVERNTAIDNLHAGVEGGEFALRSIGNRFLFATPKLNNFEFTTHFGFTSIYEFKPSFTVIYSYDKRTRCGCGVSVTYNLDNTITVANVSICKQKATEIEAVTFDGCTITEGERYEFFVSKNGDKITGKIFGNDFSFKTEGTCGYLGIQRPNYIGMCLLQDFLIESDDAVESKLVMDNLKLTIPLLNGGDIPYEVSVSAVEENEVCYLYAELGGGTSTRKLNREDRPGQYVAEVDQIFSPYIRITNGQKEEKFYFFNGRKVIADPNIYWDCLKEYWEMPEMPIKQKVQIPKELFSEDMIVTFGYEKFHAKGYNVNSGGPSEFVFNRNGELLYGGSPLTEDVFEIRSPKDKKVISLIPKETYNYEQVIKHLEDNHYFMADEDITLSLEMITDKRTESLSATAKIRDIYDTTTLATLSAEKQEAEGVLDHNRILWKVEHKALPEKLYRIVYEVKYGDTILKKFGRVFEVLDPNSKVSPAVASGLPYSFSMPNEHKWLERNSFDLWNPMPSCDVEHYISCVTDTPIEAEKRRTWELLPIFKREWFAWLGDRTCLDGSLEAHPEVVKNCDYLYYPLPIQLYPMRNDLYLLQTYTYSPKMMGVLKDFLKENPQFAEKLSFTLPEEVDDIEMIFDAVDTDVAFTYDNLKEIFDLCYCEWYDYVSRRLREEIKKQNKEFSELNPRLKRSSYGPFTQYGSATLSYHSMRSYGHIVDEELRNEKFSGFSVYEDYPYSCAYQTYRGNYFIMSALLHAPNMVMYPEQYGGGTLGGCIDGAVKFAHSPMGVNPISARHSATNAFEFVFNTPHRTEGGFKYWDTYGYHRPDFSQEWWNELAIAWKYVIENKPKRPLKAIGFVAEYCTREDILDIEVETLHKTASLKNRSEQGHGVLYDFSREAGLNAGFVLKSETLKDLKAEECEILVLPTLKDASADVISEIRRLYAEGVSLIAVSDIPGLEDIFGVTMDKKNVTIDTVCYNGEFESVYPMETELFYKATDADVIVSTDDGTPIVTRNDRAIMINANMTDIGYESFEGIAGKGRHCLSGLLKSCVIDTMRELATGNALGDGVGITLFETEKNETVLLAIDYTPFDNLEHTAKRAGVDISLSGVKGVEADREVTCLKNDNGDIDRVEFDILPHESVFIKLVF